MDELLENPVWNALHTGNKDMAQGDGEVRFFPEDIAPFVGMKNVTPENYHHLSGLIPSGRVLLVVAPFETPIPDPWKVVRKMLGFQMVCAGPLPGDAAPRAASRISVELTPLTEKDIPAMLELTALTKPGPFLDRTITFGGYHGIFSGGKLVSMAGYRLAVGRHREISAVCTHPDHLGNGYAQILIRHLMGSILAQGEVPMLHVLQTNSGAISIYEKLGFRVVRDMRFDMIVKA